jgi:transposase-like protein
MAYEPQKDIEMATKRHKAEEIVTKLRQVDELNAQGKSMAGAIRSIGVTEVTYYRWRAEYGGRKGDQVCQTALNIDPLYRRPILTPLCCRSALVLPGACQ